MVRTFSRPAKSIILYRHRFPCPYHDQAVRSNDLFLDTDQEDEPQVLGYVRLGLGQRRVELEIRNFLAWLSMVVAVILLIGLTAHGSPD